MAGIYIVGYIFVRHSKTTLMRNGKIVSNGVQITELRDPLSHESYGSGKVVYKIETVHGRS
jgi:hypothetical protein